MRAGQNLLIEEKDDTSIDESDKIQGTNAGNEGKCVECREQFFKLIVEFSDDWVYWINPDFTLGYNSTSCKFITGYDSSDELFSDVHFLEKIIHPQYYENLKRHDKLVGQGTHSCYEDFAIITKTGDVKWVHHYCQAVYDSKGQYIGRYVCNKDISNVKKRGKFYSLEEKTIPKVYENNSLGYYQIYFDGRLKNANKIFLNMLGYNSFDDLKDFNIEEYCLLNSADRKLFKNNLLKHGYVKEYDSQWIKKDYTIAYLRETASVVEGMNGDHLFYQSIVEDITEKKLAELANKEASDYKRKSEKLKTEFLATISHEIRTPLNVILNFIQMLKGDYGISILNEKNDIVDIMVEEGERIKRTIDLILEMSQLQSDTYEYNFVELDLIEDILNTIYKTYEAKAAKKNIQFKINNKLQNAKILADRQSIKQIFTQLIDNAIKYTNSGKVEINLFENKNNKKCVEVTDTGIGIDQEYIPHLFSFFSQEDNGYSRMFEGTGLGLAIVKKHCDLNNAVVEVESEKNAGTKFIITFIGDKQF